MKNTNAVFYFIVMLFMAAPAFSAPQPVSIQPQSWDKACQLAADVVKEGDLIFLEIPEYLFRKVAAATNTWTSHVGVVFRDENGEWIVTESTIPRSKDTPLCEYLQGSTEYRFQINRLNRELSAEEIAKMREEANSLHNIYYHLGFNLDSRRLFCSKLAYLVYKAIDVEAGQVQTFKELLDENPDGYHWFWRWWFFGRIPWNRRTVTPASQLVDNDFYPVLISY